MNFSNPIQRLRRILILLLAVVSSNCQIANAQVVKPNSKSLIMDKFFNFTTDGEFERYRVHGFYEKPTATRGRVSFLPSFSVEKKDIKYLDGDGREYSHILKRNEVTSAITIRIQNRRGIPTGFQRVGVACYLQGTPIKFPTLKVVSPAVPARSDIDDIIGKIILATNIAIVAQNSTTNNFLRNYAIEDAALDEVHLEISVGDKVVGSRTFSGTLLSNDRLPAIDVLRPTLIVKNRISEGNFDLRVSYRFDDKHTKSIKAEIDANKVVENIVNESRRSIAAGRASGFSFLGFGSRRKTVRQHFEEELRRVSNLTDTAGTHVVMNDASDDMIARFENSFFPVLTKDEVIQKHKTAASKAKADHKTELAKAHDMYAKMLDENDVDLEVDAAKAVASLVAQDYVGFLTNGVRFASSQVRGSGSFRKYDYSSVSVEERRFWSEIQRYTVQRELNIFLTLSDRVNMKPFHGLAFQQFARLKGVVVTGVIAGSPAHRAGFFPGIIVRAVDDVPVDAPKDIMDHVDTLATGDQVSFDVEYPRLHRMPPERLKVKLAHSQHANQRRQQP